jgi:uncharacterized protein YdiU (UPF0061 family)
MEAKKINNSAKSSTPNYGRFNKLDGSHPLKNLIPNFCIEYKARIRPGGKVKFFNFELAKNMGLIAKEHPEELNPDLEKVLLEHFGIIIINEFDEMNNRNFPSESIKSNTYMATKYLQMQHPDKTGKTSGDGRSVWLGQVKNKGQCWDVSGCGTGATRLSPATSKFNKFFKSGDPSVSYGCGYAETEEGLAALFMSEIFNQNKLETERVLAIIEFEKNYAVNIRAHQNLLRPSHFFLHLKQGNHAELKGLLDYYIDMEKAKAGWESCPVDENKKYHFFLDHLLERFAKMAARFEDDYIFCWLDWDGDNILMDGGIIDYGSVRQFGLFHHEYRYDDVERFSTSILEQKGKTRYIVQSFIQIVDFVINNKKTNIHDFANSPLLKKFDDRFEEQKNINFLYKLGVEPQCFAQILKSDRQMIQEFRKVFSYFERTKSKEGRVKVADGISWDAIFCMRDLLRELPQIYLSRSSSLTPEEFIDILKSNYATPMDLEINSYRKKMIEDFQKHYFSLVSLIARTFNQTENMVLLKLSMRSSVINKADRVTGDSVTLIVDKLMKKKKQLSPVDIYQIMRSFVGAQNFLPSRQMNRSEIKTEKFEPLINNFFDIVKEYREGI